MTPGPKPKDHTGQRFGMLAVLSRAPSTQSNHTRWVCRCDCGEVVTLRSTRLIVGHCGCCGYRRDAERHKAARAKVPAAKRRKIAKLGAAARQRPAS